MGGPAGIKFGAAEIVLQQADSRRPACSIDSSQFNDEESHFNIISCIGALLGDLEQLTAKSAHGEAGA